MDLESLCSICMEMPSDEALTSCNHFFCRLCILKVLANEASNDLILRCPYCRQEVENISFFGVPTIELANRYWHLGQERRKIELLNREVNLLLRTQGELFEDSDSFPSSAGSEEYLAVSPRTPGKRNVLPFALTVIPLFVYLFVTRVVGRLRGN